MSSSTSTDTTDFKKLGDFIRLQRGTTYKSSLLGQPGAVLIGLASIKREGGFRNDKLETYGGECPQKISLKPGDLYVSLKDITHDGHLLGAVARIPDSIERGRLTQDTVKLVFEKELFPRNYIYWLLRTPQYRNYCRSRQTGTTNLGLSREDFLSLRVPPMTEATNAIVIVLESIEKKIENLRRQNETLEAIAQTLFKHWFVDFEFPNEDGKPYKSSGCAMERLELGEIPTAWHVGKLEDFGKVITGKTPSTENPNYWGKGLPFITPTDFKNYGKFVLNSERELSKLADSEFKNLIIPEQSVVVTCIGSDMGKVPKTVTRCITNQQLNSLIFNQIKNGGEYVYQFLVSQYKMLRLIALGGSTMPIINKTAFSNIEIIIPNFLTLDKFNEIVEPVNLKIINNEQQIQTLTKTRDVLLPQLLSGKLCITE
jgi:type I restriction enzyme S subunit